MTVKIFTRAHVPEDLANAWLQHLRNFDVAHPGCHFEVAVDNGTSVVDAVEMMRIEPALTFSRIFERKV